MGPAGGRISSSLAYVGTTSLFKAAGFRRVQPTAAKSGGVTRWLMRLTLRPRTGCVEPVSDFIWTPWLPSHSASG